MNRTSQTLLLLASAMLAGVVLSACGSSSEGAMSDEDKIKLMNKAHDVPLGSGKGAVPGAPAPTGATTGGPANPLAHP